MFNLRRLIPYRPLHLDFPQEVELEVEAPGAHRNTYRRESLLLARLIMAQAMQDRAHAIHIFFDDEDECYRMLYCLPSEDGLSYLGWFEMVPPPDYLAEAMVRRLGQRAGISASRHTGVIAYRMRGISGKATCESPNPRDIRMYFTSKRPRLLDKKAGDRPGVPFTD